MAWMTPDFSAVRALLVVAIKTAPFAGNNHQESKPLPQPWHGPGVSQCVVASKEANPKMPTIYT
jgi:hypothetical protein